MTGPGEADAQHCPACATEFVAGVAVCSDCGGPLRSGELPRDAAGRPAVGGTVVVAEPAAPMDASEPDTFLVRMAGLRAEFAAKALTLEGITCRLECEGIRQLRLPDQEPVGPFAVTLPVDIYVPRDRAVEARQILESIAGEDVVGDQWSDPSGAAEGDAGAADAEVMEADRPRTPIPGGEAGPDAPAVRSEGTGWRMMLVFIVAALVLFALSRF